MKLDSMFNHLCHIANSSNFVRYPFNICLNDLSIKNIVKQLFIKLRHIHTLYSMMSITSYSHMKPGRVIEPFTVCIRVITRVYLIPQTQPARTGFLP